MPTHLARAPPLTLWLPGEPLLDHVARDGSPEAASFNAALALEATCTMLEVLTQLHAAGYSYNDLKPEQLLVSATSAAAGGPAVMMVDFGAVTQIGAMQRLGNTWTFCVSRARRWGAGGSHALLSSMCWPALLPQIIQRSRSLTAALPPSTPPCAAARGAPPHGVRPGQDRGHIRRGL